MKHITKGNDFQMRIPVVRVYNGERIPMPLPACTDIIVNICSPYRRISLAFTIDVAEDNVILAKVEGDQLYVGRYALEVKGKIGGVDWRSNEYEQIAIVDNNASADTSFDVTEEGEDSLLMDTAVAILAPDTGLYDKVLTAEEAREAAENARHAAESERIANEEERVANEEERKASEVSRIENESVRIANEQSRTAAEAERVKAENIRKQNESERVRNESSRSEAETAREKEETKRQASEASRSEAETERISNEQERKAAEAARQKAEESRQAAETARANAETKRANAEAKREINEEARKAFFAKVTEQINGKQDKLTFDTEPVEGSSNPVTSDGIFKALSKIGISIFLPVATLPTEDINPNKVYLVRDAEGENGNMYAEYIYTDGAWELIGTSKINLENYYTKSEIDALFANIKVDGVLTEKDIATVNGQKLTNGGNILLSPETIVLDEKPTKGSVNGVTSGGVYPLSEHQACFKSALPLLRAILKKGLYTEDVTDDIDSLIELLAKGTPDDVARPIITIDENNYVHITCEDKDASIYYSLYGDNAKRGSLFTEPFSMQWNCTIKAVAVLDDKSSPVAEKTYKATENDYIEFADPLLAKLAILPTTETFTAEDGTQYQGFGWDKDGDGRVSKKDAAAVTSVSLNSNKGVKNFGEFVFFVGIKSITSYDLFGCACDTIITPPSLKIIGSNAIRNTAVRKLIISEGCETLHELSGNGSLEYLSLPQSIKTLGTIGNIRATVGLDVTIPASVESCPQFYYCILNEVKIMGNYTSMRSDAFRYCGSPSRVKAKIMLASENVMVLSEAFLNFGNSDATFYVRDELLEQYKVAEFWSAWYDAGCIKGISEW